LWNIRTFISDDFVEHAATIDDAALLAFGGDIETLGEDGTNAELCGV